MESTVTGPKAVGKRQSTQFTWTRYRSSTPSALQAQVSSSHGYFSTVCRAQVLIIEAPPDASPHRIGPSVRLVSKICGEESGRREHRGLAPGAHTRTHTLSRQGKVLLEANQSSLGRSSSRAVTPRGAAVSGRWLRGPFGHAPKQQETLGEAPRCS